MEIANSTIIVTGAAHGIGEAMAIRFANERAGMVIVTDIDESGAERVAGQIVENGGKAVARKVDVSIEADISGLVEFAIGKTGAIDLFCSNAGVIVSGGPDAPDADWNRAWEINVMAHVYAARAALPPMLKRGSGYFLNTCSSAGLLTALGAAPYAVSKHASIAFAEWLAITYGDRGIRVSALCPQAVRTRMIDDATKDGSGDAVKSAGTIIDVDTVADQVVKALATEQFLILTHPETQEFMTRKVTGLDRWLAGMQKFARQANVKT